MAVSAVIEKLRIILTAQKPEAALDPDDLRCAAVAATQAIAIRAAAAGHSVRDYATTLSVVVATEERVTWAQVGDGAIVVVREEGELELVAPPENGEWVNETCFLTDPSLRERLRSGAVTGVRGAALLTDGLHGVALEDHRRPFAPFFGPLFEYAQSVPSSDTASARLAKWLRSPDLAACSTDDLTLVLVTGGRRRGRP